jgi:phosphohistidine phosphatase
MKTLYLVRHAEAVGRDDKLPDAERSLLTRGIKQARKTSRNLKRFNGQPDLLVSSPAHRALETAHVFARSLDYPVQKIILQEALYEASSTEPILEMLRAVSDEVDRLILFGHEPLMSQLLGSLVPKCHVAMPKGAVAGVTFACASWSEVNLRQGELNYFDSPLSKPERARFERQVERAVAMRIESRLSDLLTEEASMQSRALQKEFRNVSRELAASILDVAGTRGLLQRQWAKQVLEMSEDPEVES